ncbi:MAG: translation initiation factor IF-2 [Actinobacteria bacterium]|nr:translation initiation factor IF-2 [Actinomycetota bacterium]
MGNIRVHELVKELRKSNREVTDRLRKLGITARANLHTLTPEEANQVRVSFGLKPVKEKAPKKKAAKKPAAKKAAKKPAKKVAKPAAKRTPAKKAAKKPAKKVAKPAAKRTPAKKGGANKPAEEAKKPKKARVPKAAAVAVAEKPEPTVEAAEQAPTAAPEVRAAVKAKEIAKPLRPKPVKPRGKPGVITKPKKPTLKVAPADVKPAAPPSEKKIYRFRPRGRGVTRGVKSAPSTVAPKLLRVPSGITVKEFAQKAGLTPSDVIKKLLGFGETITSNQPISDDALKLISDDLGVEIKVKAQRIEELEEIVDRREDLVEKPPVVTVMGHVDHGKTLLLDAIRKTDVVSSEMGGITQHIGAYQVTFGGKQITFVDTPGHESFTAMRARGAQITDIAVLVVAADDGVMPQTLEALNHATEAEVPIIVAINKMDKTGADPGKVRQQLSERGLIPDDWGGDTVFVEVSAKEGTNLDHLLEMILLVVEIQELKANPYAAASGAVVEARLDRTRGPVATVLVKRGTARIGDVVVVGTAWGKIRAMFNDRGEPVGSAGPSMPVEILGLSNPPMAGEEFRVVGDEKKARQIADRRRLHKKLEEQTGPRRVSLENLFDRIMEGEINQFKIVLKADTQGSLEAVHDSLEKIPQEEVKLNFIHSGVGGITETDVMLAAASDAVIIGFHVRPDPNAERTSEMEKVDIRTYQIIYKLTEETEAALVGMLEPMYEEEIMGHVEVRQLFRVTGVGMIAGSYVLDGGINRNSQVRVLRDGVVVHEGKVSSLRRFKDDARSVPAGYECGVGLEYFQDLKDGDILEVYQMREVERTL